ncbi:MAG TPA: hypothetical protein ENG61_00285 [Candidatus Korarchaeota archaeon]|nr:MAG: hypothetical protein DRO64_01695 [Candidatus Bathyarchaeota archaeon]HDD68784.1 hypothetical protein [Candidatus Korarchaeota archaeon]
MAERKGISRKDELAIFVIIVGIMILIGPYMFEAVSALPFVPTSPEVLTMTILPIFGILEIIAGIFLLLVKEKTSS